MAQSTCSFRGPKFGFQHPQLDGSQPSSRCNILFWPPASTHMWYTLSPTHKQKPQKKKKSKIQEEIKMFMHVVYICNVIRRQKLKEQNSREFEGSLNLPLYPQQRESQACTTMPDFFSQSWGSYKYQANTNQWAASPALFRNLDNKYMGICVICISDYSLKSIIILLYSKLIGSPP